MQAKSQPTITLSAAETVIAAAKAEAETRGQQFSIAIVDAGGTLKTFSVMDGAPYLSADVAQDKAYTAAGWGMPTDQWHDFIKNDEPLAAGAPSGIKRLIIFGGGYPLTVDGKVVGAIGVSGAHYNDDMAVAQAGVAAFETLAKEGK